MWSSIIDISSKATKQWRSILLIYIAQLIIGIIVAMSAYQQFDSAIGSSLELDRLAKGFDRSIFSDMVNEFPIIIGKIKGRFLLGVAFFLLLSVFLHSGLLGNIRNRQYSITSFFTNAKKYFVKFLGVVFISLIKLVVTLAIIWVPFFKLLGNPLETFHSEKTLILTIVGLIILSVLLIIVVWLWSVISRYQIADGSGWVISMKNGWRILKSNFLKYYMLGIILILLHAFLTWVYTLAVDDWGAETWFCILGLVLIQQLFSIVRVWIRAVGYAAVDDK